MNKDVASHLTPLIDRFALHSPISSEDRAELGKMPYKLRSYEAGSYLLRDGDAPVQCGVLVSGFAYRHRVSAAGLRQIVSVSIPGEVYDLQQLHLATADHNVQTLTRCTVATIAHAALLEIAAKRPSVARAISATTIVDLSIAREWMLNIGRRDARMRTSHLFCELAFRLNRGSVPSGHTFDLPMTQEQLGDALGLTPVHINRTVRGLVKDGLIVNSHRSITIPNWGALVDEAGFNSRYLHMVPI